MKDKKVLVTVTAIGVVLILIVGGIYLYKQMNKTTTPPTLSQTNNETVKEETPIIPEKTVTLTEALKEVGAKCSKDTCTYKGDQFNISTTSDYSGFKATMRKACKDGYVNKDFLVITDGKSWFMANISGLNSNTTLLNTKLVEVGLKSSVVKYCD